MLIAHTQLMTSLIFVLTKPSTIQLMRFSSSPSLLSK